MRGARAHGGGDVVAHLREQRARDAARAVSNGLSVEPGDRAHKAAARGDHEFVGGRDLGVLKDLANKKVMLGVLDLGTYDTLAEAVAAVDDFKAERDDVKWTVKQRGMVAAAIGAYDDMALDALAEGTR